MYGMDKKKKKRSGMMDGGKAKRQPMMYGKMPKRKQANKGRMMYNEGGMPLAKPN